MRLQTFNILVCDGQRSHTRSEHACSYQRRIVRSTGRLNLKQGEISRQIQASRCKQAEADRQRQIAEQETEMEAGSVSLKTIRQREKQVKGKQADILQVKNYGTTEISA